MTPDDASYQTCSFEQMRDDFIFRCVSVLIQTQFTHFFLKVHP